MRHTEMLQKCRSFPSAEWDRAKLPQPVHHLIIFLLKNLAILIQINRILIAASFRFLELCVRCFVHFLSGFNSALRICCLFVFHCINLYLTSNLLRDKVSVHSGEMNQNSFSSPCLNVSVCSFHFPTLVPLSCGCVWLLLSLTRDLKEVSRRASHIKVWQSGGSAMMV